MAATGALAAFALAVGLVIVIHPVPAVPVPAPIHEWNFSNGTARDVAGNLDGTLNGDATIADGRLILDGSGQMAFNNNETYMSTGPDSTPLTTMTLVSWVTLNKPHQWGVSPLSVIDPNRDFNAIDFGERVPDQWLAGSDYFNRTVPDNGGPPVTDTNQHMLAITYAVDGTITLYMDGKFYGDGGRFPPFTFTNQSYLIGARAYPAYNETYLNGSVAMAEVFNTALDAPQIAALYNAGLGPVHYSPTAQNAAAAVAANPMPNQPPAHGYAMPGEGLLPPPLIGGTSPPLIGGTSPPPVVGALLPRPRLPAHGVGGVPAPIHDWDFASGTTNDLAGGLNGILHGHAVISNGRLMLDGNGAYMSTGPDSQALTTMTLVSWVALDRLDQSGGSALSVVDQSEEFNAIDFAERVEDQWMAGSDYFNRSVPDDGGAPLLDTKEHMLAITYAASGKITLYLDGKFYGDGGQFTPCTFYNPFYLVGMRHLTAAYSPYLSGAVDRAQVYDVVLTPRQIRRLYANGAAQSRRPIIFTQDSNNIL